MPAGKANRRLDGQFRTALYALWLAAILALIFLHAVHPLADFPANSP